MLQIWEGVCTPNGPHMFTDVHGGTQSQPIDRSYTANRIYSKRSWKLVCVFFFRLVTYYF